LQGYLLAKNAGCNCAVSSVASQDDESFDGWLKWIIELDPISVGVNYPHLLLSDNNSEINFSSYTTKILKANFELNKKGIPLENYERFAKTYNQNKIRIRECQACGRGITVDSNGNVGPCKSLLVSNIFSYPLKNSNPLADNDFNIWADRTPLSSKSCLHCPAISVCGGGCAYDAYCIYDGNAMEMDRRMCSYIESIFFDLLNRRIAVTNTDFKEYQVISARQKENDIAVYDSVGH
jgi:radical SAM protein with 4Fe4S-binding SPASM domain